MFGKKRQKTSDLPSPFREPERYEGRTLLVILENYILDCIGHLNPEQQKRMQYIVGRVYGGGDEWKATMREVLQLDNAIDDSFRQLWESNQAIAEQNDTELNPVQFAKMIVDSNFAHLLD